MQGRMATMLKGRENAVILVLEGRTRVRGFRPKHHLHFSDSPTQYPLSSKDGHTQKLYYLLC